VLLLIRGACREGCVGSLQWKSFLVPGKYLFLQWLYCAAFLSE